MWLQFSYENTGLVALHFQMGDKATQNKTAIFFQTAPAKLFSDDQQADPSR
jgi:hypothetical protein